MDREYLEKIIRTAFEYGENWGICYSGWFTPSDEQTEIKIQEVIKKILK
jgi:hypothetical protein